MMDSNTHQQDNFDANAARSMLDQLITDSKLYYRSADYKALLDFVVRLRDFAPFNAMLLHIQKPGLSYAASARDWRERFGRAPKNGARPLVILWPFGPVAFVYDVLDTEGKRDLPEDVASYVARGPIEQQTLHACVARMHERGIFVDPVDAGDFSAGSINIQKRAARIKDSNTYRMSINRNHPLPVQFTTVAHELAHLFLGHLGADSALKVAPRKNLSHAQRELEAETVAYLVCARNGVKSKSQTYLAHFVDQNTTVDSVDLYRIMRAAGQVETLLGLAAHMKFDHPTRAGRQLASGNS
jgi:hypothetical protein